MTRVRWRKGPLLSELDAMKADFDAMKADYRAVQDDYRRIMMDFANVAHDYTSLRAAHNSKVSFLQLLVKVGCIRVREPDLVRPGLLARAMLLLRAWLHLGMPPVPHRWEAANWDLIFKDGDLPMEKYPAWSRRSIDEAVSFCPGCGAIMHRSKAGTVPQNCSDMAEYFKVREVMDS